MNIILLGLLLFTSIHLFEVDCKQFTVKGTVEGIESGTVAIIKVADKDTIAIGKIVNHQFTITAKCMTEDQKVVSSRLSILKDDRSHSISIPLILECASIEIQIPDGTVPTFSGTELQDRFTDFLVENADLNMRLMDPETGDIVDSIQNKLTESTEQFYLDNRDGPLEDFIALILSEIITNRLADPNDFKTIPAMCEQVGGLTSGQKAICDAIAYYKRDWRETNPMELSGKTKDGKDFKLADLIGTKVIVLDFWASWCGPCIKDFPSLKSIYTNHDIEIVGISIDQRESDWQKGLERHALPWVNIRDMDDSIAKAYKVTAVPTKFVIDKNGQIVARNPENLEALIKELTGG